MTLGLIDVVFSSSAVCHGIKCVPNCGCQAAAAIIAGAFNHFISFFLYQWRCGQILITAKERWATFEERCCLKCFTLNQVFDLHVRAKISSSGKNNVVSKRILIGHRRKRNSAYVRRKWDRTVVTVWCDREVSSVNTCEGNIIRAQKTLFKTK